MKISFFSKFIVQIGMLLLSCLIYSQNINFENILDKLDSYEVNEALNLLNELDTFELSSYDKATYHFYLSEAYFINDNHDLAFQNIIASKYLYNSLDSTHDVADTNIQILKIIGDQNDIYFDDQPILNDLKEYINKVQDYKKERSIYHRIALNYMDTKKGDLANDYFDKYIDISKKNSDSLHVSYGIMNKGTVFNVTIQNYDSARYYFQKALPILIKYNDSATIAYNYNNQGKVYYNQKNYPNAIKYYLKADSVNFKMNLKKTKKIFYENIAEAFKLNKDYYNSSIYYEKLNIIKDSINDTQQNIAISETIEKYNNEKLRADNLESELKSERNEKLFYGALSLLLFGGISTILFLKNSKKKRLLAEQQQEIEKQKVSTLLKEQELSSINAMIEGQEKERKRIAEDLHDDIGSILTTVKLHFENFKLNKKKKKFNEEELINKTDSLLDEAYSKVRNMAHTKNSGVIANQGLLVAIENMAEKISASKKIAVEVSAHGLNNRLENSLELNIFRIIQELITNIVKHAQATQAGIHLTNHEQSLNIMVEDNGIGFNVKKISKKGMGIHSIEKRIEHLDGTMTIESEVNRGTTIIIDIPL